MQTSLPAAPLAMLASVAHAGHACHLDDASRPSDRIRADDRGSLGTLQLLATGLQQRDEPDELQRSRKH